MHPFRPSVRLLNNAQIELNKGELRAMTGRLTPRRLDTEVPGREAGQMRPERLEAPCTPNRLPRSPLTVKTLPRHELRRSLSWSIHRFRLKHRVT